MINKAKEAGKPRGTPSPGKDRVLTRTEQDQAGEAMRRLSRHFSEAVGKTVSFITYSVDGYEFQILQIRFTDGTLFTFDLLPRIRLRVNYMESRHGQLEIIRDYGIVRQQDDKETDNQQGER